MPETPSDDQHGVRDRADRDDGEHVLAADALPEHEDVLRADGDDEREAEGEAGEQGGDTPSTLEARCISSPAHDSSGALAWLSCASFRTRRDRRRRRRRGHVRGRGAAAAHHAVRGQPAHQDARAAGRSRAAGAVEAGAADRGRARRSCGSRASSRCSSTMRVAALGVDEATRQRHHHPARRQRRLAGHVVPRTARAAVGAASGRLRRAPRRPGLHRRPARVRHGDGRGHLAERRRSPGAASARSACCGTRPSRRPATSRAGCPTAPMPRRWRARRSSTSTAATTCRPTGCALAAWRWTASCGTTCPRRTTSPTAVRLGLGWGMLPPFQSPTRSPRGEPRARSAARRSPSPLYWQQWNLRSPLLTEIADEIVAEAARVLERRLAGAGSVVADAQHDLAAGVAVLELVVRGGGVVEVEDPVDVDLHRARSRAGARSSPGRRRRGSPCSSSRARRPRPPHPRSPSTTRRHEDSISSPPGRSTPSERAPVRSWALPTRSITTSTSRDDVLEPGRGVVDRRPRRRARAATGRCDPDAVAVTCAPK